MKKRYVYCLLFALPGFFISAIFSFIAFGSAAGFLWIYVYGDNTWPASAENILAVLFIVTFLLLWAVFIITGYITGKKFEGTPSRYTGHIVISACATAAPVVLIVLHQLSVGNIGPKSDDILCSEFCSKKGYAASGMPPKDSGDTSCSCFDNHGQEAVKVPMAAIISNKLE